MTAPFITTLGSSVMISILYPHQLLESSQTNASGLFPNMNESDNPIIAFYYAKKSI